MPSELFDETTQLIKTLTDSKLGTMFETVDVAITCKHLIQSNESNRLWLNKTLVFLCDDCMETIQEDITVIEINPKRTNFNLGNN